MPIDEIGGLPKPTITNYAKKVATPTIAAPETGPAQPPPPQPRGLPTPTIPTVAPVALSVPPVATAVPTRGRPQTVPFGPRQGSGPRPASERGGRYLSPGWAGRD